jgi:SAM-dependent methyltransferase
MRAPRRLRDERRHWRALKAILRDPDECRRFAAGGPLPERYGSGLSERVVEYPWLLGRELGGVVLDAGSTLNHEPVLDALLPRIDRLDIVTLAPEPRAFVERGVSYLWADVRELPLRDAAYDYVVSLSTLEHVGMETSRYGREAERGSSPDAELRRAVEELRRVLRPGGVLLASVPFGVREDFGWMRQLDREGVNVILAAFGPAAETSVDLFAYEPKGWKRATLASAASARYRSRDRELFARDGARAARAVACIALRAPI